MQRYNIFPIKDKIAWKFYNIQRSLFWTETQILEELEKDLEDWRNLDDKIKKYIKHVLAFFAVSDGVVNENIKMNIFRRLRMLEHNMTANMQCATEDIHNISYGTIIEFYIEDEDEKNMLFEAIKNFSCIEKKINWIKKNLGSDNEIMNLSEEKISALNALRKIYLNSDEYNPEINYLFECLDVERPTLAKQLFINVIMEGIYFSSSFCSIFWVMNTYGKLKGLAKANEYISRDEGQHAEFGIYLYSLENEKLTQEEAHKIIAEAVDVEMEFIKEALPVGLLGMNYELMSQYVKFVADQQLVNLGYSKLFMENNPFSFMNKQSLSIRSTDFFTDQDVTEYSNMPREQNINEYNLDFGDI